MSGVLAGKMPRTDAQWARDVEQRLGALESATTVRVGNWVMTSQDGNLQATAPGKGTLYLAQADGGSGLTAVAASAVTSVSGDSITLTDLLNLFSPTNGATSLTELETWLTDEWNSFLTPNSALDWNNLLSQIPNWLMPTTISLGMLTNAPVNVLADGGFTINPDSPTGKWTLDPTVYRSANTSMHIAADGNNNLIRSNLITVTPGQTITVSINVATKALNGAGSDLYELSILPLAYDDNTNISTPGTAQVVSTEGVPGGSLVAWAAAPAGADGGITMSGTWTVVGDTINRVAMQLEVTEHAASGDLWWDDAVMNLSATTIPQGWVADLVNDGETWTNNINAVFGAFATATTPAAFNAAVAGLLKLFGITDTAVLQAPSAPTIQSIWTAITGSNIIPSGLVAAQSDLNTLSALNTAQQNAGATMFTAIWAALTSGTLTLAQKVTAVDNALLAYQATNAGIVTSQRVTLTQLIQDVLGFNPTTLQLAPASVTGLPTALTAVSTNTTNIGTANTWLTQIGEIFDAQVVTPINTYVQSVKDWWNAVTGDGAGGTISPAALNAPVPAAAVGGTQGITTMDATVQSTWDSIATSIAHYLGLDAATSDNPLSTVQDVMGQHAAQTAAALAQSGANSDALSNVTPSIGQPVTTGPAPTQVACTAPLFAISNVQIITGAGSSTNTAYGSTLTFLQDAKVDSITFSAALSAATAPTAFYVNLYLIDPATGSMTRVSTTGNIIGSLASFPGSFVPRLFPWVTVALPAELSFNAGDSVYADFCVVNASGTFGVGVSYASQSVAPFPAMFPNSLALNRPGTLGAQPTTIAYSSFTTGSAAPWIAYNGPGEVYQYPVLRKFSTSGTVVAPPWARFADVVALGGGASGGGGIGFPGLAGSNTTVAITGHSLTGTGASGGPNSTSFAASDAIGAGAPTETFNGDSFPGSFNVAQQRAGSTPGGGGGGGSNNAGAYGVGGNCGNWSAATWSLAGGETFTVTVGAGGSVPVGQSVGAAAGAPGIAYIVFRAS